MKSFKCEDCNRSFAEKNALWQHRSRKHKQQARRRNSGEASFASRAIDAELDHAMGIHNPDYDWLVQR